MGISGNSVHDFSLVEVVTGPTAMEVAAARRVIETYGRQGGWHHEVPLLLEMLAIERE